MRPETELVVSLSRTPLRTGSRNRAVELLGAGVDWDSVLRLAEVWRVEPTVFGNLGSEFPSAMPESVAAETAMLERESRAYAVSRTLLMLDLLHSFEQAGIPVIVLKGPAIAIAAYDDCSRRTYGDADLFVRRSDLTRARDIVIERGYSPHFTPDREEGIVAGEHALEFSDSRMPVELHRSLISGYLRFNLDVEDLWNESRLVPCLHSQIRILSQHHLFLYLCAHGAKHEWGLFRWICDVAQLIDRLTPAETDKVMSLAARANGRRLLSLALHLVNETFGLENSPFPASAFRSKAETAKLVSVVKARLQLDPAAITTLLPQRLAGVHPYMQPLAFWLSSRERLIDRVACATQFFFVPAAGDNSRNQMQRVFRPIRLAANALRRLAHAS